MTGLETVVFGAMVGLGVLAVVAGIWFGSWSWSDRPRERPVSALGGRPFRDELSRWRAESERELRKPLGGPVRGRGTDPAPLVPRYQDRGVAVLPTLQEARQLELVEEETLYATKVHEKLVEPPEVAAARILAHKAREARAAGDEEVALYLERLQDQAAARVAGRVISKEAETKDNHATSQYIGVILCSKCGQRCLPWQVYCGAACTAEAKS